MNPGAVAVIALCAVLAVWYGCGLWINRRLGQRSRRWLEGAGPVLGDERETGWLGSPASGAWIRIGRARRPFRRVEIAVLLQNRELLPVWLLARLRGKQDCLIIKATLHAAHTDEVEIVPSGGAAARGLRGEQEEPWNWEEGSRGLSVAYRGPNARPRADALGPWIRAYGNCLDRFSWRRQEPQIQLQMKAANLLAQSGEAFFAEFLRVVDLAARTDDRRDSRAVKQSAHGAEQGNPIGGKEGKERS